MLTVKDGYCRLCWQQARYEAKVDGGVKRGAVGVLAAAGTLERPPEHVPGTAFEWRAVEVGDVAEHAGYR